MLCALRETRMLTLRNVYTSWVKGKNRKKTEYRANLRRTLIIPYEAVIAWLEIL